MDYSRQSSLPNSVAVLVLGILSIPSCMCYGILGVLLALIALILYRQDKARYNENKLLWKEGSYNNLIAGKVCAIIGLTISLIYLIVLAFVMTFIFDSDPFQEIFLEIEKHW